MMDSTDLPAADDTPMFTPGLDATPGELPDHGNADLDILGLDGDPPVGFESFALDPDGDGEADVSGILLDTDSDGQPDTFALSGNLDGDGVADILAEAENAENIWAGMEQDGAPTGVASGAVELDPLGSLGAEYEFPGYSEYYGVHGSPAEDMALWDQQDDPMSCAVATTNMMFRSVGLDLGEDLIAEEFSRLDIYDPSLGTQVQEIDAAINSMAHEHGLSVHAEKFDFSNPETLFALLDQGIRPLVAVDSAELSDPFVRTLHDLGIIPDSGHAVQVTGIVHGPEGAVVVINDPGYPDGAGTEVPLGRFMDAAEDLGFTGVAVKEGCPPGVWSESSWLRPAVIFGAVAMAAAAGSVVRNSKA